MIKRFINKKPIKPTSTKVKTEIDKERFVLIITLLLVSIIGARTPIDSDMWWHLRAGETTWNQHEPLIQDDYSYTVFGQFWINHSWLSQVILFLSYKLLGYFGLATWMVLTVVVTMLIVYKQCIGPPVFKSILVVLTSVLVALVWAPRPQLFSLLFLAIMNYLIDMYRIKQKLVFFIIPVIMCIWGNLHAGYVYGIMLLGILLISKVVNKLLQLELDETLTWKKIGYLALSVLFSILALPINPNGLQILKVPFTTMNVAALQSHIQEWASPDFHNLHQQFLLWFFFGFIFIMGFFQLKIKLFDLLVFIWFALISFISQRNIAIFGVVFAPIVCRSIWGNRNQEIIRERINYFRERLLDNEKHSFATLYNNRLPIKAINLSMVGILGMVAFAKMAIVTNSNFVENQIIHNYPEKAADHLQTVATRGQVFSEYDWGGYLIWFYRDHQVFVDGRTDLYGDKVISEWYTIIQAQNGFEDTIASHKIGVVMVKPWRPLVQVLSRSGWLSIYRDQMAVILVKND